ncbi:MAG: D-alanine--D-alanine ligase [Gammaproteobacteria bacterium]|nr:D-alanine--D-alanine ligase [Gammaproteobacteria bacterium]
MKPINKGELLAKLGHVVVLKGGTSVEREVSLASGSAVFDGLKRLGVRASVIDVGQDVVAQIENSEPDLVFIALHGQGGEDGAIQGLLESMNLPYTGSKVLASALGMNKVKSKQVWEQMKLKTAKYELLSSQTDYGELIERLNKIVIKPVNGGSSLGISIVNNEKDLVKEYKKALAFDSEIMAEQFIEGVEFSTGVIGDEILPTIQLETSRQFFDYEAKYNDKDTKIICPVNLTSSEFNDLENLVLNAYSGLGCKGLARVDVIRDKNGEFYLLELNTIPGMTEHSFIPMALKSTGVSFDELLLRVLEREFEYTNNET